MIKRTLAILSLLIIILLSGCGSGYVSSAQISQIKDNGALKVAVRVGNKGFCIETEAGYEGLEVDLTSLLTKEIFLNAEDYILIPSSNYTRYHNLTLKEADIAIALAEETDQPTGDFVFSRPYYTDVYGFLVRNDGVIQSIDQIQNIRIGVLNNSNAGTKLESYIEKHNISAEIINVGSYPEGVEMLSGDEPKIDAFAAEAAMLRGYINENVMILSEGYAQVEYCMVALKSNEPLIKLADEMLQRMEKDGSLDALVEKWKLK